MIAELVNLTKDDSIRIQECGEIILPRMEDMISAFYDRVLALPAMLKMVEETCGNKGISADQLVAHINQAQFRQWELFFQGDASKEFTETADKIGKAHERCGLTSDLYVASSSIILETMIGLVIDAYADEPDSKLKSSIHALIRMFLLELAHSIKSYDNAAHARATQDAMLSVIEDFDREVGEKLASISSSSEELSASAGTAQTTAKNNANVCSETSEQIESLTGKVGEMQTIVSELNSFVAVIEDVSKKTRLLALNATIEAARAGTYGRGFSVVAAEIKDLADQANKATEQISSQSDSTSKLISEAIEAISTTDQRVKNLAEVSDNLVAGIEEQYAATNQINTNLQGIMINLGQMKQRVTKI